MENGARARRDWVDANCISLFTSECGAAVPGEGVRRRFVLSHSLPMHSAPVLPNVRYPYSLDHFRGRGKVTSAL